MNLKSIWIETTNRCNLRCLTCGSHKGDEDISLDIFRKIADQCFPEIEEVSLTGAGEPLITKHFHEMCSLVLEKYQKRLMLITNGMLLMDDMELLELLLGNDVHFILSIDGIGHTYEKIRIGAKWKNVLKLVDNINTRRHESSPFVWGVNFVLNRRNRFELIDMIKKAGLEWKADYLCVLMMQPWYRNMSFYKKASPTSFKEEANIILDDAAKVAGDIGLNIILPPKFHLESEKENLTNFSELFRKILKLFRMIKWLARDLPIRNLYSAPAMCYLKYPKLYRFVYDAIGLPKISCDVPFERLFFKINGEITPCCALQNYVTGSVKNRYLDDILKDSMHLTMLRNMEESYLPIECLRCQLPMGIYKGNPDLK